MRQKPKSLAEAFAGFAFSASGFEKVKQKAQEESAELLVEVLRVREATEHQTS